MNNDVNNFSLQDIADELEISKGTLYYHYKSKDDLILDVIEKHITELDKDYDDWLNRHKNDQITKERFLEVIFYKGVKLYNRSRMHIYIINECMRSNPNLKETYNSLWHKWQLKLKDGVSQVFTDVEDKEAFSYMLMLIIDGLTVREVLGTDENIDSRVINILKACK